jgi:hypothetical protein
MYYKQLKRLSAALSPLVAGILLASVMLPPTTAAQNNAAWSAVPSPDIQEPVLDQLIAPIALYPDALLAQILMATTYPLDVAEAKRWADKHPHAEPAVIDKLRWEPSVKALLPFPPLLMLLNKEKKWSSQLSAAVVKQPAALLQSIQILRERAYANGALHTSRQLRVRSQDRVVTIDPVDRRMIYVPYYDPAYVYSAGGDGVMPPEYWSAQPYAAPLGQTDGMVFSVSTAVPDRRFYNANIDWRNYRLTSRETTVTAGAASTGPFEWQHDPRYRQRKTIAATSLPPRTVGSDFPPNSANAVNSRDAGGTPSAPASGHVSSRSLRANGM